MKQGAAIAVLGSPEGLEGTLSEGIVSALRTHEDFGPVIQITAPISPGSSGSPIINNELKVIGIATFIRVKGQLLNFGIPSNAVSEVLEQAKNSSESNITDSKNNLYKPNNLIQGSKEQDLKLAQDIRFKRLKEDEINGRYFPMLSTAKELIKEFPESALAHRALSDAYFYADLTDDSFASAKKAIDLDPENPRGWNNLAILYCETKDFDKAVDIYIHAIKLAPNDVKLLIEYANMVSTVNPSTARSAIDHAKDQLLAGKGLDIEIAKYDHASEIIYALLDMGLDSEAYKTSSEFKVKFKSSPEVWLAAARAAIKFDRHGEVRPAVLRAYQLDSETAVRGNQIYAESELSQGRIQAARTALDKAYSINPKNTWTVRLLIESILQKNYLFERDFSELGRFVTEISNIDEEYGKEIDEMIKENLASRE